MTQPIHLPNETLLEVLGFVERPNLGENVSPSNHRVSLFAESLRESEYNLDHMVISNNDKVEIHRSFGTRRRVSAQLPPIPECPPPPEALRLISSWLWNKTPCLCSTASSSRVCPPPPEALRWIERVSIGINIFTCWHGVSNAMLRFLNSCKHLFKESIMYINDMQLLSEIQSEEQIQRIFDVFDPYVLTISRPWAGTNFDFIVDWLHRPRRNSGAPRLLNLNLVLWPNEDLTPALITCIKKKFLETPPAESNGNRPLFSIWFIRMAASTNRNWHMEQFSLRNIAGENLTLACGSAYLLTRFSDGDEELVAESAFTGMRPHGGISRFEYEASEPNGRTIVKMNYRNTC